MQSVSPVIPGENLDEINVAENQPEYQTLPVVLFSDGNILSRWAMDEQERAIVGETGELFIVLLTFGRNPPECHFQVDHPIAPDAPGEFLKPRTSYPSSGLPVIARNDEEIWYHLKLTDADRATVVREGDVYFFMQTNGAPVTPSMIQVTKPDFDTESRPVIDLSQNEITFAPRWTDKLVRLGFQNNLKPFPGECVVCGSKVIISASTKNAMAKNPKIVLVCTICRNDSGIKPSEYFLHPGGAEELVNTLIGSKANLN